MTARLANTGSRRFVRLRGTLSNFLKIRWEQSCIQPPTSLAREKAPGSDAKVDTKNLSLQLHNIVLEKRLASIYCEGSEGRVRHQL